MQINEVTKPSPKAIFESLSKDSTHSFSTETLQEIAEAVATHKDSGPGMTVDEAIEWLNNA